MTNKKTLTIKGYAADATLTREGDMVHIQYGVREERLDFDNIPSNQTRTEWVSWAVGGMMGYNMKETGKEKIADWLSRTDLKLTKQIKWAHKNSQTAKDLGFGGDDGGCWYIEQTRHNIEGSGQSCTTIHPQADSEGFGCNTDPDLWSLFDEVEGEPIGAMLDLCLVRMIFEDSSGELHEWNPKWVQSAGSPVDEETGEDMDFVGLLAGGLYTLHQ